MTNRPVVLTVAGSDSAGMAGLQMDIRVQAALGVHTACAVSANTAQNDERLLALEAVPASGLRSQLQAASALRPAVMKVGMLANAAQVAVLCDFLDEHPMPVVWDPVLRSSAGHALRQDALPDALLARLLRHCTLLTPNLEEAAFLDRLPPDDVARLRAVSLHSLTDAERLAARLLARGTGAVLLKGGHRKGSWARDYFVVHAPAGACPQAIPRPLFAGARLQALTLSPSKPDQAEASPNPARAQDLRADVCAFWLTSPAQPRSARGTGCALASAIAAAIALGHRLADAVVIGKMAINQGLRQAYACGGRRRTVHLSGFPDRLEDLPLLHHEAVAEPAAPVFPDCGPRPLGLYPVVDRAIWLERLLPLGITTVQLRVKDLQDAALAAEIAKAIAIARRFNARLFINDHWELAIAQGAYGVHLGQEDLRRADIERIRRAGLRLGLSTHCHYEVAAAHALRPSYIACGPIFHTDTKRMPWRPHGVEGLRYWRRVLAGYPLVGIGGIARGNIGDVAAAGADGIALISAITAAEDPEASARELLASLV